MFNAAHVGRGKSLSFVGPLDMSIDWVEVNRTAHQIELDHGRNGYLYAERLALQAKDEARPEDPEFWEAVAAALRPRGAMPNSSFNPDALTRAG